MGPFPVHLFLQDLLSIFHPRCETCLGGPGSGQLGLCPGSLPLKVADLLFGIFHRGESTFQPVRLIVEPASVGLHQVQEPVSDIVQAKKGEKVLFLLRPAHRKQVVQVFLPGVEGLHEVLKVDLEDLLQPTIDLSRPGGHHPSPVDEEPGIRGEVLSSHGPEDDQRLAAQAELQLYLHVLSLACAGVLDKVAPYGGCLAPVKGPGDRLYYGALSGPVLAHDPGETVLEFYLRFPVLFEVPHLQAIQDHRRPP